MADPPDILRTADVPEMGTAEPEAEIEQLLMDRAQPRTPKRKRGRPPKVPPAPPAGAIVPQTPRGVVLRRDAKGRLLPGPGQSPNPGGRSTTWREAQKHAEQFATEALDFLVFVIRDPLSKTSDRLVAAEMLLNRGLGKAVERAQIELTAKDPDKAEEKQSLVIGEQKITF